MTTDALGPCPPPMGVFPKTYREQLVTAAYADWQRRRAENAEALLREGAAYWTQAPASPTCPCDTCDAKRSWPARVAAHFAIAAGGSGDE